jgi:DNA primase
VEKVMDYVENLLKEKGVYYRYSANDLVIRCLSPDHEDKNPSLKIDKVTGIFHCLSCGYSGNIFKYYGIFTNQSFIKVAKLKEKLKALKVSKDGLEYPNSWIPYTNIFRGISKNTLTKFGAFYIPQEDKHFAGMEDRIIFPIKDITGKVVMFLGRHTLSNGNPRYRNFPSGVTIPLFPASLEENSKSIILVEGMFDFLNCYDKGLTNVVCTFGTKTLQKDTREKLLAYKTQGVTKVYIMFDGDSAGDEAAKKLKPLVEACEFEVEIIELEPDTDPGELSEEYVHSIKEYVNK